MEKLDILPQTVFKFKCDEDLLKDTLGDLEKEKWIINNVKFITENNVLVQDSKYKKLHKWFHKCLKKVKDELNLNCEEFKIIQSWGNKEEYNQWHHVHTHPNSFISGVLYLTNSDAYTWFSVENIWSNSGLNLFRTFDYSADDKMEVIHKQETLAGDLIIFPSSLRHSVNEHTLTEHPRYTISFNAFPCGKVGDYNLLMGMEINIK